MTYRQFVVPSGQDIIEALGVEPTMVAGTETAQRFEVTIDGDTLDFTYDVHGRSIQCLWSRGETLLVEVFREGATHFTVYSAEGETHLRIEFETDSLRGLLNVRVFPSIQIADSLLLA
jgi:hypothetical protein